MLSLETQINPVLHRACSSASEVHTLGASVCEEEAACNRRCDADQAEPSYLHTTVRRHYDCFA
jgi:hypothetical protein